MNLLKLTKRMVNMYDRHTNKGGLLEQADLETAKRINQSLVSLVSELYPEED